MGLTAGDAGAGAVAGEDVTAGGFEVASLAGFAAVVFLLPPTWKSFWKFGAAGRWAAVVGEVTSAPPLAAAGFSSAPAVFPRNPTVLCIGSFGSWSLAEMDPKAVGLSPCKCSPDFGCTAGDEESAALESATVPKLMPEDGGHWPEPPLVAAAACLAALPMAACLGMLMVSFPRVGG